MPRPIYLAKIGSDKLSVTLEGFLNHLKETDRGASSKAYTGDVRRFTSWFTDRYACNNIKSVSPLDLIEYRRHLQEHGGRNKTGAAPATVNRVLTSLKIFFEWLKKEGHIRDNPVQDIKQVAVATPLAPKWLDRNEQARLMHVVRKGGSARDEAMIGLMLHAGLRIGELCTINKEAISISDRKGQVAVTGKGNKYRAVPLNSTIRNILGLWFSENKTEILFPNRYGKPISARGAFNLVVEYAYRAKIGNVSPHTLRHTFCKNAIDSGTPIDQVAIMAGHSSLDITKRYTTPSMGDLQKAVEIMAWE